MPKGAPQRVILNLENDKLKHSKNLMGLIADEAMKMENTADISEYIQDFQINFISTLKFNYSKFSGYKILCMVLKLANKHQNYHQVLRHSAEMALEVVGKVNRPHSEIYLACFLRYGRQVAWHQYCDDILDFVGREKLGITVKKIAQTEDLVNQYFAE